MTGRCLPGAWAAGFSILECGQLRRHAGSIQGLGVEGYALELHWVE